jgi:predicted nucleic acid-binding protein
MATSQSERGILDTSTVILLERLIDISSLPLEPLITVATLAELSVGPLVATTPSEQATRQFRLQQVEADFVPLPFDSAAARAFGSVAASLHRTGRKTRARAFDAMIAAIAVSNDLPLYTCNPSDFEYIDDLDLRSVPHPDAMEDSRSS